MSKKKVIAARDLKDCLPNLPLKTRKSKKKIKGFIATILCFPEIYHYTDTDTWASPAQTHPLPARLSEVVLKYQQTNIPVY